MTFEIRSQVFIWDAAGTRTRHHSPPSVLASKFAILFVIAPELVTDFLKAGLLRRHDALQVLQSVQSTFSAKPAPKRREAALRCAFGVWRADGPKSEKILKSVDIHVETWVGWRPANSARFSDGWTLER